MFDYFINIFKNNKLVQNSAVFFVGSIIINAGNYIYHLITARMLSVSDYGELQALLSIFLILSIPMSAIATLIIKYTANFKGEERFDKIYGLFKYFSKKLLTCGVVALLLIVLLQNYIVSFLNLSHRLPVIILGLILAVSFLSVVNKNIIQGVQKFRDASVVGIIEVGLKILFTLVLIYAGLALTGAIGAALLAGVLTYIISFWFIKFIFKYRKDGDISINNKEIILALGPIFFSLLFLTFLYNIDIVLAKHFMLPELAGQYGALSVLGRIIFFFSGSIVAVMFSMSAEAHKKSNREDKKILKQSLILIIIISLPILVAYFVLPQYLIVLLLGKKFLTITAYVGWFGLAMFFYSLINVFARYFISINKTNFIYILLAGVLLQAILIILYHDNIWQIVKIMNIAMFITLLNLSIYYFINKKSLSLNNSQSLNDVRK